MFLCAKREIRTLEHFFLISTAEFVNKNYGATLLLEQSNAFSGEKQCFAPRKAMLGRKAYKIRASGKSVLKVGFPGKKPFRKME